MKNKLICLSLLLIIILRLSLYLSSKIEKESKEENKNVISRDVVINKNGSEYIKELEDFGCKISRLIKEVDGWKADFEIRGNKDKILELLKVFEKYEITTYDMMVSEGEIKLTAQLYCK